MAQEVKWEIWSKVRNRPSAAAFNSRFSTSLMGHEVICTVVIYVMFHWGKRGAAYTYHSGFKSLNRSNRDGLGIESKKLQSQGPTEVKAEADTGCLSLAVWRLQGGKALAKIPFQGVTAFWVEESSSLWLQAKFWLPSPFCFSCLSTALPSSKAFFSLKTQFLPKWIFNKRDSWGWVWG